MFKYLLPLIVFIALVTLFIFGLKNDPSLVPSPYIDKPLPKISLPVLGSTDTVTGMEAVAGEVSMLNIWATWCIPCRQEHALLVDLAKSSQVPIVGLNYKDNDDDAIRWLKELGNPYHIVLSDKDGVAGIDLGVYGVPETFILDQQGIVKYKHIGPLTEDDVNERILPLVYELRR